MNNKYRKTMDKVVIDDSFKNELKQHLSAPKQKNYRYILRYASVFIITALTFTFFIVRTIDRPLKPTKYVVNLNHEYYQNIEQYNTGLKEKESLSLDFTSYDKENIILVKEIKSYIKNNVVYSTVVGSYVISDETVTFDTVGGSITKKQWDETYHYTLTHYDNESHISLLSPYSFELEIESLYYISFFEDDIYEFKKVRKSGEQYEIYDDLSNQWFLAQ